MCKGLLESRNMKVLVFELIMITNIHISSVKKVLFSSDSACNEISQKTHKAQKSFMGLYRNKKLEKVFSEKLLLFPFKTTIRHSERKQTPSL